MDQLINTATDSLDYVSVTLLIVLENLFPPLPSEVIMPAAGAAARSGEHSLVGMVLAGTLGSLLGALPWYGLARWVGTARLKRWVDHHGHWLGTDAREVEWADDWFDTYGYWAVIVCRLIPGVRTLISVPAGLSETPFVPFLLATTIGTAVWSALLAGLGYWLQDQNAVIVQTLKIVGLCVIGLLTILYVVKVVHHHRLKDGASETRGNEDPDTATS